MWIHDFQALDALNAVVCDRGRHLCKFPLQSHPNRKDMSEFSESRTPPLLACQLLSPMRQVDGSETRQTSKAMRWGSRGVSMSIGCLYMWLAAGDVRVRLTQCKVLYSDPDTRGFPPRGGPALVRRLPS